MDTIMVQNNNKWNRSILNSVCDEDMNMKVPPPSPQDASMLETIFSKHLSAKMNSVVSSSHDQLHSQHAKTLEKLLNCVKKPYQLKRRSYKRPSQIPILSSRIHKKKKKMNQQDALSSAFQKIHISNRSKIESCKNKTASSEFTITAWSKPETTDVLLNGTVNEGLEKMDC